MTKSIYEKRYITSKQAQAAADKAELPEGSYSIEQDSGKIGGATWMVKQVEQTEAPAPMGARQEQEAAIKELQESIPNCKTLEHTSLAAEILNAIAKKFSLSESVVAALDEAIGARVMEIEGEQALTQAQVVNAPGNKPGWVKASTVLKPTKLVWAIADELYALAEKQAAEMGGQPHYPSRKEIQDACVARGIASGTARTQFQHWFKQRNESAKEARAQIVDGKIVPAK